MFTLYTQSSNIGARLPGFWFWLLTGFDNPGPHTYQASSLPLSQLCMPFYSQLPCFRVKEVFLRLSPKRPEVHLPKPPSPKPCTTTQGDRWGSAGSGNDISPFSCCQWKREQDFDLQLLERAVQGERKDREENGWLKVRAVPVTELDLEPQDYDLDISREVRTVGASPSPSSLEGPKSYSHKNNLQFWSEFLWRPLVVQIHHDWAGLRKQILSRRSICSRALSG